MYIITMSFEFDTTKAKSNLKKHGVAFSDLEPIFNDPFAITVEDEDAKGESRFITVGIDALGRITTVCWNERGENIRIISARLSSANERKQYEG